MNVTLSISPVNDAPVYEFEEEVNILERDDSGVEPVDGHICRAGHDVGGSYDEVGFGNESPAVLGSRASAPEGLDGD